MAPVYISVSLLITFALQVGNSLQGKPSPKKNILQSPQNATPINVAVTFEQKSTSNEDIHQQIPQEKLLKKNSR
jgi:hypothetical protein